jgi:hypothetical protein
VVEVDTQQEAQRQPLQEPEAQVEAEVLPEVGGPTVVGPQPLGEPAGPSGQLVPVVGGQTAPLPPPQDQPGPAPGAGVLPTGRTGPSNWQYKVEVIEKKTGRMASDLYRSITRWVDGVEAKILLARRKGGKIVGGRLYQGGLGPWYYTEDFPPWLQREFTDALVYAENTGEEYFPEPHSSPASDCCNPRQLCVCWVSQQGS